MRKIMFVESTINGDVLTAKNAYYFEDTISMMGSKGSTGENVFIILLEDLDFRAYIPFNVKNATEVTNKFKEFLEFLEGQMVVEDG